MVVSAWDAAKRLAVALSSEGMPWPSRAQSAIHNLGDGMPSTAAARRVGARGARRWQDDLARASLLRQQRVVVSSTHGGA